MAGTQSKFSPSPLKSDLSDFSNSNHNSDKSELCRGGKFAERSEGKQGGGKQRHPTRLLAFARSHPPRQGEGEEESVLDEKSSALRLLSNIFSLAQFCDRAACKRANECRGNAERCLTLYSECVPVEAREFIVDLMTSRELGYSFEEAMRRDKEGVRAFFCFCHSGARAMLANPESRAASDVFRLSHGEQTKRHALSRRDTRSCAADS